MSGDQNWRTEVDAGDYFLHQKKQLAVADRRPVIRKPSDLVGPGINSNTVRLDDFNDLLATFNGYYSSTSGAANAPTVTEAFVGYVISDAVLGGRQVFTSLDSGNEYSRTFTRSSTDPESIGWGAWSGQRIPPMLAGTDVHLTPVPSGVETVLEAPDVLTLPIGDASTYERSAGGIKILRQGVYTGGIEVGSSTTLVSALVYTLQPHGASSLRLQHFNNIGESVFIPFTVWALDGLQAFSVSVLHNEVGEHNCWWRFSGARIGDAV